MQENSILENKFWGFFTPKLGFLGSGAFWSCHNLWCSQWRCVRRGYSKTHPPRAFNSQTDFSSPFFRPLNLDRSLYLMHSQFQKSMPLNYCEGHAVCVRFSLPRGSFLRWLVAVSGALSCSAEGKRGRVPNKLAVRSTGVSVSPSFRNIYFHHFQFQRYAVSAILKLNFIRTLVWGCFVLFVLYPCSVFHPKRS